jgi:hypothetical protein
MRNITMFGLLITATLFLTGCVGYRYAVHQDQNNYVEEGAIGVGVGTGYQTPTQRLMYFHQSQPSLIPAPPLPYNQLIPRHRKKRLDP